MRIDAHTHIGQAEGEKSAGDLLAMLDAHEIDRAIAFPAVSGLTGSPAQVAVANDYVVGAAARYPERIVGFATVNPYHTEEAWEELDRAATLGLRGLKLHPPLQGFVLAARNLMDPIFERLEALGWPVIIHTGLRVAGLPYVMVSLEDVRSLALAFPTVPIIVAHMGWGGRDGQGLLDLARDCENVWFESSGVNHPHQIEAVAEAGALGRIMYGSDYPFLEPPVEMLKVSMAGFGAAEEKKIMGENAARLLGGSV